MIGIGVFFAGLFGFLLGSALGSPIIGLIIGGWIGHKFDRAVSRIFQPFTDIFNASYERTEAQQVFFEVTFAVMGCLAKSDGVVSKEEIQIAKRAMDRCRMNSQQKAEAKDAFNRGKSSNYNLQHDLMRFRSNVGNNIFLLQLFLDFQMQTVRADAGSSAAKEAKLQEICQMLGIQTQQGYSHQRQSYNYHNQNDLSEAYKTLGVSSNDSNQTIKKAYRKLMAEHHPDRLIAKGLPQEMIDIATEKASKIQQAYTKIAKAKGIK